MKSVHGKKKPLHSTTEYLRLFRSQRENHVLATLFFWRGIPEKPKPCIQNPILEGNPRKTKTVYSKRRISEIPKNSKIQSSNRPFQTLNWNVKIRFGTLNLKIWNFERIFQTLVQSLNKLWNTCCGTVGQYFLEGKTSDGLHFRQKWGQTYFTIFDWTLGRGYISPQVGKQSCHCYYCLTSGASDFSKGFALRKIAGWICVWQFLMFRTVLVFFSSSDLQIGVPSWTPF